MEDLFWIAGNVGAVLQFSMIIYLLVRTRRIERALGLHHRD